jgi:hypothetical protein
VDQQHRALSNGLLIAGLLLTPLSFLVYFGNALAMEAAGEGVAHLAILAMIAGNILVVAGLTLRGMSLDRLAIIVLVGGVAGALFGWGIGSILFPGGNWYLEWIVALCLAPYGMWLALLAGIGKAS